MILPTGTYRASAYLEAARRLGVDVVTASERAQALASTMGEHFLELPLEDAAAAARLIVERSASLPLDAVVAVDDEGLLAAAIASHELGLRHSPVEAVRLTRDKAAMRSAFAAAGVPQPAFEVVPAAKPSAASGAAARLGYPVVLKPTSLSASRGVIRADTPAETEAAARRIARILADAGEPDDARLVIEVFVPGPEVAVEGICTAGELEVVAIFDKPDPLDGPFFEETIYLAPSELSPESAARVGRVVASAVAALGLTDGPVHAEVRLPGQGSPAAPIQMIEVAARTIGGRCSRAFELADGSSLEELVIATALGRQRPPPGLRRPSGVLMIPIPVTGVLRGVRNLEAVRALEHVTGIEITIPVGRPVRALPEGDRYLGFVFAAGDDRQAVAADLRRAEDLLVVDVARPDSSTGTDVAGAEGRRRAPDGRPDPTSPGPTARPVR